MKDPLRQVMLAADGAGELATDSVATGIAEHPICGDLLELDFDVQGGIVRDLAWRAQGCPATVAVAAAARAALCGERFEQAEEIMRRRLAELGGLDDAESHALALFLRALRQAAT